MSENRSAGREEERDGVGTGGRMDGRERNGEKKDGREEQRQGEGWEGKG